MILKEMLRKILINTSSSPSAGLKEIRLRIYSAEGEVGLWLVTLSCLFYGGLNVVGVELNRLGEKANEEERIGNTKIRVHIYEI